MINKIKWNRIIASAMILSGGWVLLSGFSVVLAAVGWIGTAGFIAAILVAITWVTGTHDNAWAGIVGLLGTVTFILVLQAMNALPFSPPTPLEPAYAGLVQAYDEDGNLIPSKGKPGELFAYEGQGRRVRGCILGEDLNRSELAIGVWDPDTELVTNRLTVHPTGSILTQTGGEQLWCFSILVGPRKAGVYVLELTPDRENISTYPITEVGKLIILPPIRSAVVETATSEPTNPMTFATPTVGATPVITVTVETP